jgi:peptidoglycan/xylan/chitin deacetylase (PgdA/CDA1 family)
MRKKIIWITGILFLLACQTLLPKESTTEKIPAPLSAPGTESATRTAQTTKPATPTFSPTSTSTDSPTPTLVMIHQGPDAVTVPILLYHHIESPRYSSEYYMPVEKFEEQMHLLHDWGYTTITLDLLLKAIHEGADLPARPLLLTFDDGQPSVYDAAFPIMQKYGFTGIIYLVGSYLDAPTFMTTEQAKELAQAGWEIGSHSMSHKDLTTLDPDQLMYEIFKSREVLSEKIGAPVNSFAYPFGFSNDYAFSLVHNAGYTSAVGVGYTYYQSEWNIFLLQRRDVRSSYDLKRFATFLPWQGDPAFLPTDTPTLIPTITKTPRPTKTK